MIIYNNNYIIIQTVEFCFGTEVNENPVDAIYFYSKTDANIPVTIKKEQVSFTFRLDCR